MKKKNLLKDLIYIQENKSCTRQTINGLFRAIVEPILESNLEESIVIFKLENLQNYSSLIKRLEFTSAKIVDLKENLNIQAQGVEFMFVLSRRYGAIIIFDFEQDIAQYYLLHNSKTLSDILEQIQEISGEDFQYYIENFKPDRRENELMNLSIRKVVAMLDESAQEVLISEREKEKIEEGLANDKISHTSHEIRNQLSICDLYSNIVKKKLEKLGIDELGKEIGAIQKSLKLASNFLWELKSFKVQSIETLRIKLLIESAIELSKVYIQDKNIEIKTNFNETTQILADENKFLSVLINLLKNAIEAIEETGEITIEIEEGEDNILIFIANNGDLIEKAHHEKIFETGFSTKEKGRGFGLDICKKMIEGQNGTIRLVKSDKEMTIFEINMLRG